MRVLIIIVVFFAMQIALNGQTTNSPYTVFGAGQIENRGFGVNESMGGAGFALRSGEFLNRLNPASYCAIDSLSLLFEVGFFGKYSTYQTSRLNQDKFDGNISYLALGFRVKPWWAISAGIVPYSSMGYTIYSSDVIDGTKSTYYKTFTGSGSINQAYLGNAFRISKNLSLGIHSSYIFGSFTQAESAILSSDFSNFSLTKTTNILALRLDYGLQYFFKIKKWNYGIGLVYGNSKNLGTSSNLKFGYLNDTTEMDIKEKANFLIPEQIGLGLSAKYNDKLTLTLDYEYKKWSEATFVNTTIKPRNSERYSFGIEYSPNKNVRNARSIDKLRYRFGTTINKSYLVLDNVPINSKSVTFGVGIPLEKKLSLVNIGFEAGILGSKKNGLIKENFYQLNINFTLHDIWFQKPKYD